MEIIVAPDERNRCAQAGRAALAPIDGSKGAARNLARRDKRSQFERAAAPAAIGQIRKSHKVLTSA